MRISLLATVSVSFILGACAAVGSDDSASSRAQDIVAVTTASSDASVASDAGAADASVPTVATYAEVAPLIADHCGSCHHTSFSTLAKVKTHRDQMIEVMEQHVMPRNDPFWSDTADGQKVLDFLHESPELQ